MIEKYFTKQEIKRITQSLHIEEGKIDEIWDFFEELIIEKEEEIISKWEKGNLTIDSPYGPRNKYTLTIGE